MFAQPALMPLAEVKASQKGTGRTVFRGFQVESFNVEILGVLENIGPRQSLILARLSGPPLETTGVIQGMSGSPVYIDGRLVGAVAMAFPFSKEPIAGIRPIEEMLRVDPAPPNRIAANLLGAPASAPGRPEPARLVEIATPVSFGGFTTGAIEHFSPQLRALGLEPRQALSGGGRPDSVIPAPPIEPGAMISVQLVSGDLSVGADGTVTHIDGKRIYAFGHRLLAAGDVEMPFARSEVLTLLPNLNSSFKISSARQWLGAIIQDRNAALSGDLGRRASMLPVTLDVSSSVRHTGYKLEMVRDRFLSPFLLQMAVYSAIDSTERTVGAATLRIQGRIEIDGSETPVKFDNMYASEFGAPAMASLGAAMPLLYAMQSGLSDVKVSSVSMSVVSTEGKKQYYLDRVYPARPTARPGETVELFVSLAGENGVEALRKVLYPVPAGSPLGTLYFTVADGAIANAADSAHWTAGAGRTRAQLISQLNSLRRNNSAWVRVWRADPSYQVQGEDLAAPPPSVAMILARAQGALGSQPLSRSSKLTEMEIPLGDYVVSGSRTVQVEIKE
jgi:hypothetical protein